MISDILAKLTAEHKTLVDYINSKVQLTTLVKEAVLAVSKKEVLGKNHLLVRQDMVAHRLYFIVKGSARTFYYHDGKDVSSWIYREGQLVTSWSSFFTRSPSYESLEVTEDSILVSLSYEGLQELYQAHPKMQEFGRIMVEEQLVFLEYFYKGFFFMTAKEKYDLLLSIFPDITQRVNLGHIASFLGMSQETLSRIRR